MAHRPHESLMTLDASASQAPHDAAPRRLALVDLPSSQPLIDSFTARLIAPDADDHGIAQAVADLRRAGWTLDAILLTLFTGSARRLGDYWLEDRVSFVDVTIAIHRLTVQLLDLERAEGHHTPVHGGRVLLATAPDDQHAFGLLLLGFFLRRAGWTVSSVISADQAQLLDTVRHGACEVVALSVGHNRAAAPLTALIESVRAASRQPGLRIVVGGPAVIERPEIAFEVGADIGAIDAVDLIAQLEAGRQATA